MEQAYTQPVMDLGTGQVVLPVIDAPGATVVELHGDIDLAVVEPLRDGVDAGVELGDDVLVDLADVTLLDCASLSVLVRAGDLACRRGHRVCLVAPAPIVRRTLAACGLDMTFPVYHDRGRALQELSSQRMAA
ncbi:STAS domain-containing protein [Actinoplanes sp. NPDC026619]|uniref:STAS domain-containing protein n=1 Tax=Actinoplanes sp. NPDC026619 TaxID=3155798 RepID=UPI0033F6D722